MDHTEINETFGRMRSLLLSPSPQTWKRLCGYLDRFASTWDDPYIQQAVLHYVKVQLEQWPGDMPRYAQHLWLTRAIEGKEVPQLQFATAMQLISQKANEHDVAMLFNNPNLVSMRHIDLRAAQVGYEGISAIIAHPWLDKLEVIDVRHSGLTFEMCRRLRERFAPPCRVLCS